jgi:hypothetical protein
VAILVYWLIGVLIGVTVNGAVDAVVVVVSCLGVTCLEGVTWRVRTFGPEKGLARGRGDFAGDREGRMEKTEGWKVWRLEAGVLSGGEEKGWR